MGFKQTVKVVSHDANTFLRDVEDMIQKGGRVLFGHPFLSLPYEATFEFINKEYVTERPGIIDYGRAVMEEAVRVANYTQEQLEMMDWDAFRDVCKVFGIKGRERSVMIEQYMKMQAREK
jgi:hypothetical protein